MILGRVYERIICKSENSKQSVLSKNELAMCIIHTIMKLPRSLEVILHAIDPKGNGEVLEREWL